VSAKQLHNAHYQSGEAIIHYGFHPRSGETVIVVGRSRRGEEVALTIRQPDGTLAHLPIWMTQDRAAAMSVTKFPRLSLAGLRELRLELDACLSSLRDESRREGDEHAPSAIQTSPSRPLRGEGATESDRSRRSDKAIASDERAPDRGTRCHRRNGGKR